MAVTDRPIRAGATPTQSRAKDTRLRLLEAAVDCLVEVGYRATTTPAILERAHVSRGSMLHQFPSREALLIAAIRHVIAEGMAEMASVAAAAGSEGIDLDDATRELWGTFRRRYFWASIELWVAARTESRLHAALYPEARELGRIVEETTAQLYGPVVASHPAFAATSELLITSMRGTALTYSFSPRAPETEPMLDIWIELARRYLSSPSSRS